MADRDLPTLLDELHGAIRRGVAAGFAPPAEIIESAVDLLRDEADPAVLRPNAQRMLRDILADHQAEQATWPTVTDCDRLDAAFAALEAAGIVCRQDFSCCGTCGAAEIWGEAADVEAAGASVRGYAFYHMQDTEAAVEGRGVYLSYGAAEDGEAAALAIANEVVAALERQGLRVSWDGQWSRRIGVALDWKRRRSAV
jgi:hypothetical protein